MTTPYNSHSSAISAMNNLIDKHVPLREAALQEHYMKADETRSTYSEAAERFKVDANSIHSYRQYRKLPKLRSK